MQQVVLREVGTRGLPAGDGSSIEALAGEPKCEEVVGVGEGAKRVGQLHLSVDPRPRLFQCGENAVWEYVASDDGGGGWHPSLLYELLREVQLREVQLCLPIVFPLLTRLGIDKKGLGKLWGSTRRIGFTNSSSESWTSFDVLFRLLIQDSTLFQLIRISISTNNNFVGIKTSSIKKRMNQVRE